MVGISRLFQSTFTVLAGFFPVASQADVTVFAAASLRGAMEDVAAASEIEVNISYAGSGLLARQIAQGAPADVVVLANVAWMNWLSEQDVLLPKSQLDVLSNQLVLVGPVGSAPLKTAEAQTLLDRLAGGKLAVGHTKAVPAGIYAREWMDRSQLWTTLQPHLAETENVRAALALVARGEVALGVVYKSDALAEPNVEIVYDIPTDMHSKITYSAAIVAGRDQEDSQAFHAFLKSQKAQDIFVAHGFLSPQSVK